MISEAIVLAGGKGTRLQSVVADVPKPMANIAGRPFLEYQLDYLIQQDIKRVVLSVGYKADIIINHFGDKYKNLNIVYAHETQPLGTGGGIRFALEQTISENVFVLNGDTFFNISLRRLAFLHQQNDETQFSMALKPIENNGRYGGVKINDSYAIQGFMPKDAVGNSMINAGIYCINKAFFLKETPQNSFSIEDDFFVKITGFSEFKGFPTEGYFVDIGIPEDYQKANDELPAVINHRFQTLLLDRDGVINQKIDDDYVRKIEDFVFNEGVKENFHFLNQAFRQIFVVTNQRGISRGLFTEETLNSIHDFVNEELEKFKGKIDKFYFCPCGKVETCTCRKPNTGMADMILADFPNIDFSKAIFVGDSISDLQFARNIGAKSVFIANELKEGIDLLLFDEVYEGLNEFIENC
jgi:D-glycero-alpha-D-manno-heptose 1-phosphate guanylyltransferase